jgi:putative ABC transport system permease protein
MRSSSTGSGRSWSAYLRDAFASSSLDADIVEELAQHAEAKYDELRADGASEKDALVEIDRLVDGWRADPMSLRRISRRAVAVIPPAASKSLIPGAWSDAVYGWRLLRASPGYAAMTILTIALGVGAVTTLFSVVYGVLLRPLPWGDTERLVRIVETRGGRQGRVPGTMMNGSFLAWAESPQTIEGIGTFSESPTTLTGLGDAVRIPVARITPSTFELLKARPIRGRIFESTEGRQSQPLAIIAQGLWEQRFATREDILGQPIVLDGVLHTIIGVMPRDFRFPTAETRAWVAWRVPAVDQPGGGKAGTIMRVIARLKPGVTTAQAASEGTARASTAPDAGPVAMSLFGARDPIQITVEDAKDAAAAEVRPALIILLIAAALLFITAIANVANMQLARATVRHREITIRAALGAGTARLARQLLMENAMVGVLGSALGLALTVALQAALPTLLPAGFPRVDAIEIDGRVLGFTLLLSVITSVTCGVLPLLHVRRIEIARALSDSSAGSAGAGRGRVAGVRAVIVASQVAVTSVLVIGGALLARSFTAQLDADRGYDSANVLTAMIPFPQGYAASGRVAGTLERIADRLRGRPGVTHAATGSALPLASSGGYTSFQFPSSLRGGGIVDVESIRRVVSPEYFGALGIRVGAGRPLLASDTESAPLAVVVNRSFVSKYLDDVPIERAIGFSLGGNAVRLAKGTRDALIVGVVNDVKQEGPDGPPQPEMFVGYAQLPGAQQGSQAFIVLRTIDDPATHVEALRTAIREVDPALAVDAVMTMDQRIGTSLSRPRLYAVLFLGFALVALVIAGAGLFGVLSHTVSQRSRELAVRTALGASRGAVIAVALKQMSVAMIAGVIVGVAASAALSSNLAPFIYGVSTRDVLSFGVAPVVLLVAGALACIVPARRVAQTDPVAVLRDI